MDAEGAAGKAPELLTGFVNGGAVGDQGGRSNQLFGHQAESGIIHRGTHAEIIGVDYKLHISRAWFRFRGYPQQWGPRVLKEVTAALLHSPEKTQANSVA